MVTTPRMRISNEPEILKTLLLKYGRVIVEVDKIANDYTRSCKYGDLLIVEPSSPKITKARRYVVGMNDKLIYCSAMQQKRNKDKLIILGIGEISISDIVIWCNAKNEYQLETFEIMYNETGISYKWPPMMLNSLIKKCNFAA